MYQDLLKVDRDPYVRIARRQTLLVITGLVTKLAGHDARAGGGGGGRFEASYDLESPAVYRHRLRGKIEFLELRFRVSDLLGL